VYKDILGREKYQKIKSKEKSMGLEPLNEPNTRIQAVKNAANTYVNKLQEIRDQLAAENTGSTLGKMVGAQMEMTETETRYAVESGLPKKVSQAVAAAAAEVKKAAG
jgi:hypothetical protein